MILVYIGMFFVVVVVVRNLQLFFSSSKFARKIVAIWHTATIILLISSE